MKNRTQTRKTLPHIISQCNCKVVKQTDEVTTVRVLGVPYFGPEYLGGKDLQGEYFDKHTDFAWDPSHQDARVPVMDKGLSYYDHAFHSLFGTDPIGVAKFYAETEEGQWWDIEIARAYRYHDFLLQLAEKGVLGASSQPVQTSVEVDWDSGHIEKWHTVEVSLTPTPANPLAIAEVAKSFDYITPEMLKALQKPRPNVKTIVVKADVPGFTDGTEEESDDPDIEQEVSEDELEDAIDAAFADESEDSSEEEAEDADESEDNEAEDVDDTQEVSPVVVELQKAIKHLTDTIAQQGELLSAISTEVNTSRERDAEILKRLTSTNTGIAKFATHVAKALKGSLVEVAEELNERSQAEREADEARKTSQNTPVRSRSSVPAGAPGTGN